MFSNYNEYKKYWDIVDDVYAGVPKIKSEEKAKIYLPPHPSEIDGDEMLYKIRLQLTHFDNAFRPTIDAIVGIMQKNPAKVRFGVADDEESPPEVCELNVYGNAYDDGLQGLKWRLNHAQVLYGRAGLLLDIITDYKGHDPHFVIQEYPATKILDGEKDKWVLLDESTEVFDESKKEWTVQTRWRVLGLNQRGIYYSVPLVGTDADVQKAWKDFDILNPPISYQIENGWSYTSYPSFNGHTIDFIPFTVCNAKTIGINDWQMPPYFDIACDVLDAYNNDSFYRKEIANHTMSTLVVTNAQKSIDAKGKETPIAAGGVLWLNGDGDKQAAVTLLQSSGSSLSALKEAKDDILEGLKRVSIQELLDRAGANSSGDAITLRMLAGTATVMELDLAGAKAIEEQLCFAARWAGATWEEVGERISYTVDTSYAKTDYTLGEIAQIMSINATTKLLSNEILYELIRQKNSNMPSYDDNLEQLEMQGSIL